MSLPQLIALHDLAALLHLEPIATTKLVDEIQARYILSESAGALIYAEDIAPWIEAHTQRAGNAEAPVAPQPEEQQEPSDPFVDALTSWGVEQGTNAVMLANSLRADGWSENDMAALQGVLQRESGAAWPSAMREILSSSQSRAETLRELRDNMQE